MNHSDRVAAFIALGQRLQHLSGDELADLVRRARNSNTWFDEPNVTAAVQGVAELLTEDTLRTWASRYPTEPEQARRVGVVMAGNIPLVGFHDLLCVLISGHYLLAKPSADDKVLMTWIAQELTTLEPRFAERISFVERLNEADAFIATGSNNTARYFEYYFSKKPNLIRRNRTSLAILTGEETADTLAALGRDIFQYYGLGCRNVSKLYVPENYSFSPLLDALQPWERVLTHNRYQNNYDYNKSILLVNNVPHYDNGFLLLNEAAPLVSPISVLHYGRYTSEVDLVDQLTDAAEQIQCIVSDGGRYAGSFAFGQAQSPKVTDYADGVDTMAFLAEIV
ncbi:acyl-CoA reductase [Hymenobacter cellulosivorans]|uniref:Acyl-CoA reductase n=1 Tax=Hymenobacter cellulosivorans TaxID=2932249 RepID=A0ABY4F5W1_9BACT|nr:acyl-CoA reductase [Hymenobacter cellulosivorans]UOQ51392.1 acyl-CoA reductase [Hymenobacter cellulosivorans]